MRDGHETDAGTRTVEVDYASPAAGGVTSPVVALARLFATAALYPPTHARIVDVAGPILAAAGAADPSAPFALDVGDDSGEDPGGRLREQLRELGILRIELSPDVTTQDLVACARALRLCTIDGSGPAAFRQMDLASLPSTIRVYERCFAEGDADDATPAADDFVGQVRRDVLRALSRGGAADRAAADAVKSWAERMNRSVARTRSAAEVLADARRTLPQALPGVDWAGVLDAIREAMDLHLREAFKGERHAEFDGATTMELEMPGVAQDDLVDALDDLVAANPAAGHVAPQDGAEALSILLPMLCESDSPAATDRIVRRLTSCLAEEFGPHEMQPLTWWMRRLAARAPRDEFDRRLAQVAAALRAAGRDVARVLIAACGTPHRSLAATMWPHLAFELVTGPADGRGPEREALTSLLAGVAPTTLREESARMRAVVGRGAAAVATDVFFPPRAELRALYEVLIDTPPEAGFAAVVAAAVKRRPPAHPAAGALVALAPTDERTHRFVARLLREGDTPSAALESLAVDILVDALRGLPKARRNEDWVESAVRALARMPCAAADAMLRDVRDAREMLVLRAWPDRAARAAAAESAA